MKAIFIKIFQKVVDKFVIFDIIYLFRGETRDNIKTEGEDEK